MKVLKIAEFTSYFAMGLALTVAGAGVMVIAGTCVYQLIKH